MSVSVVVLEGEEIRVIRGIIKRGETDQYAFYGRRFKKSEKDYLMRWESLSQ